MSNKEKLNRVIFLFDCGPESGLGHLRRCMHLASAFQAADVAVSLFGIGSDQASEPILKGFDLAPFDDYQPLSGDMVIVDSYTLSATEINKLFKGAAYSVIIDDTADRPIQCDMVINPNLYGKQLDYSAYKVALFMLDPQFHLLDPSFGLNDQKGKDGPTTVVLSFGGTDDGGHALWALQAIIERRDEKIILPVPDMGSMTVGLLAYAAKHADRVRVVEDGHMPSLFSQSQFYLGGGGTMVLEALASGVMPIACSLADNQRYNLTYLQDHGLPTFILGDNASLYAAIGQMDAAVGPLPAVSVNGPQSITQAIMRFVAEEADYG